MPALTDGRWRHEKRSLTHPVAAVHGANDIRQPSNVAKPHRVRATAGFLSATRVTIIKAAGGQADGRTDGRTGGWIGDDVNYPFRPPPQPPTARQSSVPAAPKKPLHRRRAAAESKKIAARPPPSVRRRRPALSLSAASLRRTTFSASLSATNRILSFLPTPLK